MYYLAAVLVAGNQVLSVGFNDLSVNGLVQYYQRFCLKTDRPFGMHAELCAVRHVRKKTDLTGAKIYVARVKCPDVKTSRSRTQSPPRQTIAMARPCESCEVLLRNYGIKRAYYTIDKGHYGILNLVDGSDRIVRV